MTGLLSKERPSLSAETEDDCALARLAGEGDPRAQAELVDRLMDQVRRTASYLVGASDGADDLAQSALIRILGAVRQFRGESSLAYWAERITVHTFSKWCEKRRRRRGIWERTHWTETFTASVDEQTETRRARVRLAGHLSSLRKEVRAAMVLHYLNGHSIADVADLTGVPVNTVRGRLRTGRSALRKKILNDPLLRAWIEEMYR